VENITMPSKPQKTAQQMYPVIRKFMSTELSQREFCELNQLELYSFQYWLRKYRQEMKDNTGPDFSSIEIELPSAGRHIVIRTKAGVEIRIPV